MSIDQRAAVKAVLQGEFPEQIPQFEWGYWPETVERWRNEGMPADKEPWEVCDITYYDRVPVNTRFCPEFELTVLSDDGDHQVIRDQNGIVQEITKGQTSMPRYLSHPVTSLADFKALIPRLNADQPERFPQDWPSAARNLANRKHVLVMGGCEISFFGWHRDLMGVENLLMAYYDQPELIHAISEHHLAYLKRLYTRILPDIDFDFIFMWEDMSFKNGSLISPALVREFMLPYYRDLIGYFKGLRDLKVMVDSDGDVRELIPLFLDAGVDGMLPFECAAGMNICEIRREYPEMIISGGIDKREIAKGQEAIDRELEQKLPAMFAQGRYLPSMDHHVPPEVSYEDFRYYLLKTHEIYTDTNCMNFHE